MNVLSIQINVLTTFFLCPLMQAIGNGVHPRLSFALNSKYFAFKEKKLFLELRRAMVVLAKNKREGRCVLGESIFQ